VVPLTPIHVRLVQLALAGAALVWSVESVAQVPPTTSAARPEGDRPPVTSASPLTTGRLNLTIPDIAAFTEMGVSPSTVSKPDNIKDFVTALSTGVSASGDVGSGLGIEISPVKLLANEIPSLKVSPALINWLGGLRISEGTSALSASPSTQNNAQISEAAAGRYGYSTYNPESDPRLRACLGAAMASALESQHTTPAPPLAAFGALSSCRKLIRAANLAPAFAFEVVYAHSERAVNSTQLADFHPNQDTGWASVTVGYDSFKRQLAKRLPACTDESPGCRQQWADLTSDFALLADAASAWAFAPILFGRVDSARVSPATSTTHVVNVYVAGRVPFTVDGWSIFVEGGHQFMDVGNTSGVPKPNDTTPFAVGGEVQVSNGTWLGVYGSIELQSGAMASLGNIKWSLGENAPF
jgi:hypothetical protein